MSSHMYARPKERKCKGNKQMQVSQLPSEPLSYFPMTIHTLLTKCRSRILKAWSQTLEKCDQTDVEHQPLSIWWETPTMTQSHPSTDERGVPSNSPAQWRQGLSLPAARHAYTHTFPSAHTEKKVTPGWHTRSRQSHGWFDKAATNVHTSIQVHSGTHAHTHGAWSV